jgi:hypothetical protein
MKQKEAELDKEITGPEETLAGTLTKPAEVPGPTLVEPGEEAQAEPLSDPVEATDRPEKEPGQALLPLASGVGRRVKGRQAASLAELELEEESSQEPAEGAEEENPTESPLTAWRPRESAGLGRGGLAAAVLLLIFVPTIIFLLFQLYDTTGKIDAMQANLTAFSANTSNDKALTNETALVLLLNKPNVKIYPFKVENLSPTGRVVLYTTGKDLAFTYGNLDPLNAGQLYALWLSTKPAGSAGAVFTRLGVIPDDHSQGAALVVQPASLPANFNLANYAEISVTIEPTDQPGKNPTGPRAFSLDLSQFKS